MGKVNASNKITFENQEKKYGNKIFLHKSHQKYRFDIVFIICYDKLMPEEALTSLPFLPHIAIFAGQA